MTENIPLAHALESLRAELKNAAANSDPSFQLEVPELELELTVQISRDYAGSAMNQWSVVSERGSAKENKAELHRLRIVLKPRHPDVEGVQLSTRL